MIIIGCSIKMAEWRYKFDVARTSNYNSADFAIKSVYCLLFFYCSFIFQVSPGCHAKYRKSQTCISIDHPTETSQKRFVTRENSSNSSWNYLEERRLTLISSAKKKFPRARNAWMKFSLHHVWVDLPWQK